MFKKFVLIFCLIFLNVSHAKNSLQPAVTEVIPIGEIRDYSTYSPTIQKLILKARELSQNHLTYLYGSADPKNHGMDCSGTIYYLLNDAKIANPPRSANDMYNWVKEKGKLHEVTTQDFNSSAFSKLKPGDLLFWSGTYSTQNAISHVMLYLGKNSKNQPIMFGASDGRYYQGKRMWGVSVFDFELPKEDSSAKFVGYSCIPALTC
jgi:hypothetical protein